MDNTGSSSRPLIVGALAVNIAVIATGLLWHPSGFAAHGAVLLVVLGLSLVSLGFSIASFRMPRGQTPGFVVRPGTAFIAPADRRYGYFVAGQVVLAGVIAWYPSLAFSYRGDDPVLAAERAIMVVIAVLVTCLNFASANALSGRPRLELTPDGVRVGFVYWWRAVRWDELAPGLPLRQPDRDAVTLTTTRPGQPAMRLALNYIRVHPWFLADAIRYYVDHPDGRTEIGTPAGYDRLMTALGAAPVPS